MLQLLKKAVLGSLLDSIPKSTDPDICKEIEDNVTMPRHQKAEEFAAWCVSEFRNKIREDKPSDGVVLQYPSEVSYTVFDLAEEMLIKKGWCISNFGENKIYVAPCEPREKVGRKMIF